MNKLLIATHNTGKLHEFKLLFSEQAIEIVSAAELKLPDVEETGQTFIENALLKARAACAHSGLPSVGDDSGLVVPSLNGEPGLYSARYAGEHHDSTANIAKLLDKMKDMQGDARKAVIICVMAFLRHADDPMPIIAQGVYETAIMEEPSGEGGFGYDPVLWSQEHQCALAEISKEEKNAISHRGRAMRSLISQFSPLSSRT
ncbi:MAG: non-canonical purine NTP pyrophosphatase [marine bacterium B5-7]|nr:MAG: non-canonical purine NTP pyrophosphatase [marine bacterium B5-7]